MGAIVPLPTTIEGTIGPRPDWAHAVVPLDDVKYVRKAMDVTTNVPGPQLPLFCLGRRMLAHLPFVPLSHGVRIGVAILSYDGNLAFGVTGDRDTAADVDVLADAVPRGLDELQRRLADARVELPVS